MSVSAASHRRKATTYGKASRKPMITAGNSFAKAAGTDMWDIQNSLVDWNRNSVPVSRNSVRAPRGHVGRESSARSAIPESTKLNKSHLLIPKAAFSAEEESLFDVPSSGDDHQQNPTTSKARPRKRRKISPEPIAENGSLVYDDASLQRHIAAESQMEFRRSPSFSIEVTFRDNGRPAHTLAGKEGKSRSGTFEARREGLKARAPCRQDVAVECHGIASLGKASNKIFKGHPIAEGQARHSSANTPPHKVKKAFKSISKDVARSMTSKERFNTPESEAQLSTISELEKGDRERPSYSQERFRLPNTPPKPIKNTEGTTTPRQRELWDKLLVEDAQTASPSTLDLPGLTLAQKKSKTCIPLVKARKATWRSTKDPAPKVRPRKIVDTLHPREHDQNHINDDFNQDSDSDCRDSFPESIEPESSAVKGAITVQNFSGADSQSTVKQCRVRALSSTSQPVPLLQGAGLKVTYARQRSYLSDNDLDDVAMLYMPIEPESVSSQGVGCKGLGQRLPKSHSMQSLEDDFGDSQGSQGGAMRSIHELREAGGNVRLVSELEAILDDIEEGQPAPRALRRISLLDLVAKLQEPSNCRLFVDQGLDTRLLAYAGVVTDLISNSLLAAAILELMAGPTSTLLLSQISNARVVDFLIGLLELDQDLASQAKLHEHNLSRHAQQEYNSVCASVSQSAAWRAGKPTVLSCHVLALQCLEYLVRQTREFGSSSVTLPAYALRRIVARSIPPASLPLPQSTPMSAICAELTVSILESCTISNAAECQESLWEGETLQRVMSILPLLSSWREDECATSRTLTLRLYCNLTNHSPGLCEDFSTPDIVEALLKMIITEFEQLSEHSVKQQHSTAPDSLILSLGVFVNLAESSIVVRQLVMNLHYGPRSYLDVLLELFLTKSKNAAEVYSEEETNLNVAVGYLSVLLGFLCLNKSVKASVSARLAGGTSKQLVDALEEFLRYYRQIGQEIYQGEVERDSKAGYVGRLQGLVEDVKD